jgi:PAS domain S-box-containing protein
MNASEAVPRSQDATVTVDRSGIVREWGTQVTAVVGHRGQDIVGRNINIIIPPALRWLHWWGFDRAMRRGRLSSGELTVPALCTDGRIVVAHATMKLISGNDGAVDGATVTFTGTGPSWQGTAWRVALGPLNAAGRLRRKWRQSR